MAWDIRKNGSTSIGGSVLPDLRAVRGLAIGRTGVLPWAGRMSFTTDDDVLTERDEVELLRDATVEWSGRVRTVSQATDRQIHALRWKITAQGWLSELIAVEAGASTERYDDITVDVALGHLLDAVGIGASRRDIGSSARELAYWQLLAEYDPWAEVRRLLATAGPRARLFEDRAGLIVFRDAALPALSRTLYGRAAGSGARAIITDIDREEVGRDRVINVVRVPYAVTPEDAPARSSAGLWAPLTLTGDRSSLLEERPLVDNTRPLAIVGWGAFLTSGGPDDIEPVTPGWPATYEESWSTEHGTVTTGEDTVTVSTGDVDAALFYPTPFTNNISTSDADTDEALGQPTEIHFSGRAAGSEASPVPAGATDVVMTVTAIGGRFMEMYGTYPNYMLRIGDATGDDAITVLNADSHFTVTVAGGTVTVTPLPIPGGNVNSDFNDPDAEAVRVNQYDVTIEFTWQLGIVETSWAQLRIGEVGRESWSAALEGPDRTAAMGATARYRRRG